MRADPDSEHQSRAERLAKDNEALATLMEEQRTEIRRLKDLAWSARKRLWYKVGRKLGLLPEIRPDEPPSESSG